MKKLAKWEVINSEDVSPSKWFPLSKDTVRLPNGRIVEDYYVAKLGDVVMIAAITKNKEIVMVRQYKHGVKEIIIELPAGRIEHGTPLESAIHELQEETGILVANMESLGTLYNSPSKESVVMHNFFVENSTFNAKQKFDETEDIDVLLIPLKTIDQKIVSGEICATDTLSCLYLLKLKHPELFS